MPEIKELVEYTVPASREDILSWKQHPVTRAALQILKEERIDWSTRMGDGETLTENTTKDTARAVGIIQGLRFCEDILNAQFLPDKEAE